MTQHLQYRLNNSSLTPPEDAWPNIAAQLDADPQQQLSLKLQQATLTPPAGAWENILAGLDETPVTRMIPMSRRRWARLAVAASVIGIVVIAGTFFFMPVKAPTGSTASGNTEQQQKAGPSGGNNSDPQANQGASNSTQANTYAATSDAFDPRPVAVARSGKASQRIRYARVKPTTLAATNAAVDIPVQMPVSVESTTYIRPASYLTIPAPNGQPAKISARFADAMGYMLLIDEPADNMTAALKSISWKRRLQTWSNKLMSNTGFMPAATNFMDIVELERMLQD